MLNDYMEKYSNTKKETVLDNAIAEFKLDKEKRHEELLRFIDDFINSEEYEQYLEYKSNIKKRTVFTQHSLTDLEIQETVIEDKYPLTTQSRKMYNFMQYFDKYIKNKKNMEIIKMQEQGIKIIKEKIREFRSLYESNKDKMYDIKEIRENKILEEFCDSLNIDLSTLSLKSKNKIRDKVVCYQKIKHCRNLKTKSNIMDIVRKLTEEYKRKKQIDKTLNKTYLYKVKKNEKILNDMEIVGEKIILKPRIDSKIVITEEEKEDKPPIEDEQFEIKKGKKEKPKKDKISKKNKKSDKKESKTKKKDKKKKGKEKKSKKSKSSKDKKKKDELIIPPIPICNLRKKIGPENYEKISEVLRNFENLEDMLEDQHILAQKYINENLFDDKYFCCKPTELIFKNYGCGKIYKKKLKIINTSTPVQKLRILETTFADLYDALLFKIEPLFGIQKLATGCFLELTIFFSPEDDYKQINGKIIFVAYNKNSARYQRFCIPIHCIPCYSDVVIYPNIINFGKIAQWRAYGLNYKTIKLKNNSNKPCKASIGKVLDPLELKKMESKPKKSVQNWKDIEFISNILEECLDNVFSNFEFEHGYIKFKGFEEIKLKVKLKNVDHVGNYFEKYCLYIYDTCEHNSSEYTGCQEISVLAETTDYFIKMSSNVLDFGVCMLNSIYQLSCDIYNNSSITQTIHIKFPSNITEYIKTDVATLYIPSQTKRTSWLKFLPRKSLLDIQMYYDKTTSILEFPIHICVLSKTYPDVPPIKATIFAVLAEQKNLTIKPLTKQFSYYFSNAVCLNLGECSIFETINTDIELMNNTLAPQIYGFTNVPQCVMITPNYGFEEIMPNEKKTLKLCFTPGVTDVIDSLTIEGTGMENVINFRINLETVSFLGQCKMEFNKKQFRKTVDLMLKELKNQQSRELINDIEMSVYYIKINLFSGDAADEECSISSRCGSENTLEDINRKKATNKICTTQLWLKAKIIIPLVEFSHQYVEFPSTPCGSYSIMQIELRSLKTDNFFIKSKSQVNYVAVFKILGGTEEMRIEPTCGTLKKGEHKNMTLIVKPNTPNNIVLDTAKNLKYSEVYECKKQEYELKKQKHSRQDSEKGKKNIKGKKGKDKKSAEKKDIKKGKEKKSKEDKKSKKDDKTAKKETKKSKEIDPEKKEPEIIVTEKELVLDYLDFYPAEMFYWRNLTPYLIETEFTCTVNYDSENMTRKSETLYLNAVCKVVKPDFITNLKLQRIDFGNVVIGMKKSESVIIQNINYNFIEPQFSLLSPVGPFALPFMKNVRIPPEHFLEIPLNFEPQEEGKVEEYFEIRSGATTLSLILQGMGDAVNIDILPNFIIFRLLTKKTAIVQCPVEIKNKNESEITITIEKLFELEGMFKEIIKDSGEETTKEKQYGKDKAHNGEDNPDKKKIKSDKSSKKTKGSKKDKGIKKANKSAVNQKFSNELTELEKNSIRNYFSKKTGEFCFDTLNIEENKVTIQPRSTKVISIGFGMPDILLAKKLENKKKLTEKQKVKGKKGKGDKKTKSSKSSKNSKKSKDGKGNKIKTFPEDQVYYVAKYNIMLNKTFLKDLILISTFTG